MNGFTPVRRVVLARIIGLIAAAIILVVLVLVNSKINPYPVSTREPRHHQHQHDRTQAEPREIEELEQEQVERIAAEYNDKIAVIETSFGTIKFRFFPESAPRTVENFVQLAGKGFYNGSPFHRVVKDFVIQGGSPDGSPDGGPGYTIPAEFNERMHVEGTVGMARGADPNSAGSQFYICLDRQPRLDGDYTVFGQVIEGMDVARRIGVVETGPDSRPLENTVMKEVRIEEAAGSTASE